MPRLFLGFWASVLRFLTDADTPGVEKLAVCSLEKVRRMRTSERLWNIDSTWIEAEKGLAPPMAVFNVKGWSRSLAAVAIMMCAYEKEDFRKAALQL